MPVNGDVVASVVAVVVVVVVDVEVVVPVAPSVESEEPVDPPVLVVGFVVGSVLELSGALALELDAPALVCSPVGRSVQADTSSGASMRVHSGRRTA